MPGTSKYPFTEITEAQADVLRERGAEEYPRPGYSGPTELRFVHLRRHGYEPAVIYKAPTAWLVPLDVHYVEAAYGTQND